MTGGELDVELLHATSRVRQARMGVRASECELAGGLVGEGGLVGQGVEWARGVAVAAVAPIPGEFVSDVSDGRPDPLHDAHP
jgi:hypothetical protein